MRGRFIVLEGIDGSGTTTQARALTDALSRRGHSVLSTHEPSDGSVGRLARQRLAADGPPLDPHALALLFAADRLDHVAGEIEPALADGRIVVCDRYVASSWAYQSLACPIDWVRAINRHAPWPDLTLWLDLPVADAQQRIATRRDAIGTPQEIFDAKRLQERIAIAYAEVLGDPELGGVVRVDATKPQDEVAATLVRLCIDAGL